MNTGYIVSVAILAIIGLLFACRRPRDERPCDENPSGEHAFILVRDTSGVRLRCMECGCKSSGWAVFQRPEPAKPGASK